MIELITVEQALKILKIQKSNLYRRIARNEIPHYRFGRLIRLKVSDLEKWIESQKFENDSGSETLRNLDL